MRLIGGTRTRHAAIMVLSALLLVKYVSFMDVAYNFSNVTVAQVGSFILSALTHTESWTLIMLALFAYAAFAFIRGGQLSSPQVSFR